MNKNRAPISKHKAVWLVVLLIVLGEPVQAAEPVELVLLNWSDDMGPGVEALEKSETYRRLYARAKTPRSSFFHPS
ncbi:hypothetical protein [Marinobacter sp. AC-23]|uniref:hypothetical protein n=1 Tax=Marinobacter sp. AC-23 TaxID=1879031 RepID=UPI0008DDB50D|nr:hypothetical protein [Marinobacter sp. AC-23]OHY78846.1 hypothetical protein BCA33_17225 [Marinobacter sp. AC-23]